MTRYRSIILTALPLLFSACGLLDFSKDSNCLNPASNCFIPDVTAPSVKEVKIHKTSALEGLAIGSTINTLYAFDITYSEQMKNADDASLFSFTGGVGDVNLSVSSVSDLGNNTYRYLVTGQVRNGAIEVTSDATDYTGKKLNNDALHPLTMTGSVNVSVEILSISSNYLKTGEQSVIQWQHDYNEDSSNDNDWWLTINEDCNYTTKTAATALGNSTGVAGVDLAPATAQASTIDVADLSAEGVYELRICVRNDTANKEGSALIYLTRDDTEPDSRVSTNSVAGGIYKSAQTVELSCVDVNCDKIIYSIATANSYGSTPNPTDPSYDVASGTITNGTLYSSAWVTPYSTDPTITTIEWMAVDKAGNIQGTLQSETYTIDSSVPEITVSSVSSFYLTENTTNVNEINSVDVTFSSSLDADYIIKKDGSDCPAYTDDTAWGSNDGTITATTDQTISVSAPADYSGEEAKELSICVRKTAAPKLAAAHTLNLQLDNTVPKGSADYTTAYSSGLTATPDGSDMVLTFNAAYDASPVIYDIYEATAPGIDPDNDTPKTTTEALDASACSVNTTTRKVTCTLTGRSQTQVYYYVVRARDKAGNQETNTEEAKSGNAFIITATNIPAAGVSVELNGSQSLTFTGDNTKTFSGILQQGESYNVQVSSQPAGYVCALTGKQIGIIGSGDETRTVNCEAGSIVGGQFRELAAAPLDYRLYQGKVASLGTYPDPDGITTDGTRLYFTTTTPTLEIKTMSGGNLRSVSSSGSCNSAILETPGFIVPMGLTNDGTNVYIADHQAHSIYKYSYSTDSVVHIAGKGDGCDAPWSSSATSIDNTDPLEATFKGINSLVYHENYLYIAEFYGQKIRRMNLNSGVVSTILSGYQPGGMAVVTQGATAYLYFTVSPQHVIRRFNLNTQSLDSSWVAGTAGTAGFQDSAISSAQFNNPMGMTADGSDLYIAEDDGDRIRRIDLNKGVVSTIAGSGGTSSYSDGTGINASFHNLRFITTDGRRLYATDRDSGRIIKISDNGLVGYWPLAGNANDYASDVSTNYDATIHNAPAVTATDRYGNVDSNYKLNGTDQYFVGGYNNLPRSTDPSTTCVWVNPDSIPLTDGHHYTLIGYGGSTSGSRRDLTLRRDSASEHRVVFRGYNSDFSVPHSIQTGKWTHYCATFHVAGGQQQISIFINGKLAGRGALATNWNTGTGNPNIGGKTITGPAGDEYFNGTIADVRIYNRVLNEGEINELAQQADSSLVGQSYNTGATGLLSHYRFESDNKANDAVLQPIDSNTGTVSVQTGVDGSTDGALRVDGGHLYGDDSGLPAGSHPRTVCSWVKPASYPAGNRNFLIYGTGSGKSFGLTMYLSNRVGIVTIGNDPVAVKRIPLNSWAHICGVYSSPGAYVYIDGKLVLEKNTFSTSTVVNGSSQLQLARDSAIDDVRIYNNALSSDQIRQLATQIPAGLVARYDFVDNDNTPATDEFTDTSGWGATLTNGGYDNTTDRFGLNSAVSFNGTNQKLITSLGSALPQGSTARTMCAWFKADDNPPDGNNYSIMHHGDNTENDGHVLSLRNSSGTIELASGFWNMDSVLNPYDQYGPGSWQYICGVYDKPNSINKLYLNGSLVVDNSALIPDLSINSSTLYIGVNQNGSYFKGDIDDVLVYNRALSAAEIQALVRQPNKRIWVTDNTTDGNIAAHDTTGTPGDNGIEGADFLCNNPGEQNLPGSGTYKAMMSDGSDRLACTSSDCGTEGLKENKDWVLRPGVTYVKTDNTTPVFTANGNSVFDFGSGSFLNSISDGITDLVWTGLNSDWRNAQDCQKWSDNLQVNDGSYGDSRGLTGASIDETMTKTCDNTYPIYCVEQ